MAVTATQRTSAATVHMRRRITSSAFGREAWLLRQWSAGSVVLPASDWPVASRDASS